MNLNKLRTSHQTALIKAAASSIAASATAAAVSTAIGAASIVTSAAAVIARMAVPSEPAMVSGIGAAVADIVRAARSAVPRLTTLLLVAAVGPRDPRYDPADGNRASHDRKRQQLISHDLRSSIPGPLLCIAQLFPNVLDLAGNMTRLFIDHSSGMWNFSTNGPL